MVGGDMSSLDKTSNGPFHGSDGPSKPGPNNLTTDMLFPVTHFPPRSFPIKYECEGTFQEEEKEKCVANT